MKFSSPSWIEIDDGEYARGKKIQVSDNQHDAVLTMLERLDFLLSVQQPGDRITLDCQTVSTRKGDLTECQLSFTRHPVEAQPS